MRIRRGEIHWASVPARQAEGHEQFNERSQPRPWVVVSDERTLRGGVVIACPITSKVRRDPRMEMFRVDLQPEEVVQTPDDCGTVLPGTVLVEQVRVMSVERFPQAPRSRLGKLKPATMARVDDRLLVVLKLDG